jgi:outer membrane receptor protein involved in Fe transport
MNRFTRILGLLMLIVLGITFSVAQSSRGTVTGVITDPSGAVVPNATATLKSDSTGLSQTTKTNNAGIYRFESVIIGDYTVTIEAQGFGKSASKVSVSAGLAVARDFALKIASAGDDVIVEAAAPELQTEDATRGAAINATSLATLPISGQNSLNLMLTVPGVVRSNQSGSLDSGIGAVNGARARSNNFMIDGTQNNDISVAGPAYTITNNDAIQEVNIQTSNFTSEFGRSGGAIVNQVLKSGGNQYHGTLATIYKSEVLNASNNLQRINFANGSTKDLKNKFKENIPAFTFGGPVRIPRLYNGTDKTFFFVAGQWDRYSENSSTNFGAVPTDAGVAVLQPLAATCPNVASFLSLLGPARGSSGIGANPISIALPNNPTIVATSCGGGARTGQVVEVGNYVRAAARVVLDNNHQVKIDHRVNDKQNMSFRWLWDSNSDTSGNTGINPAFDIPFRGKTLSGQMTHAYTITNNLVNEFRFSYSRNNYGWFFDDATSAGATAPDITIGGLSNLAVSSTFPQGRIANSWQFQDGVSWTHGKHSFRFGGEFLRQLAKQVAPFNSRGAITYSQAIVSSNATTGFPPGGTITPLANFIDNFGGSASNPVSISFGSGLYRPNLFTYAFFGQDSWKIRRDLTFNYGVRYENFGQPANVFKYPAFVGYGDADIASTAKVKPDNNNFAPSIGLAWNPTWNNAIGHFFTGDGKAVLRAGYQVSYDTWFNNLLSNMAAGSPNALANQTIASVVATATPRGRANFASVLTTAVPVAINPYSQQTSDFDQNIRNPYYHRFSLGIQREIPKNMVVDLSYVGTLGRQLYYTNPLNPALPNATGTASATQAASANCPAPCLLRFAANRGLVQVRDSGLTSSYNAMQATVRSKGMDTFIGRMAFVSAYTWSKNLDVLSETFATNSSGQNPSRSPVFGSLKDIDWGPSDNDRRHVWTTALAWDVRGPKHGILYQILGGWQFAPIITMQSGTPYTVLNGTDRDWDGSTLGDRGTISNPNASIYSFARISGSCATGYSNPASGCVDPNSVYWISKNTTAADPNQERRNANRTLGYFNVDANVLKTFRVTERWKLEYRAEIFNLNNNQNWDTPVASGDRNITTSSASRFLNPFITKNGGNRSMRMGLKVIF